MPLLWITAKLKKSSELIFSLKMDSFICQPLTGGANYLNKPIVSVRPSGRENWNEIIILCAKGYIADDKSVLYYEKFEDIISVLHDIFIEADNDEYEVFECYTSTCKTSVWSEVEKWVYETYQEIIRNEHIH